MPRRLPVLALLAAVALAACSGVSAAPTPSPEPTVPPTPRPDADQARITAEGLEFAFGGASGASPAWWPSVRRVGSAPAVEVRDGGAWIGTQLPTTPAGVATAQEICVAIAAKSTDAGGDPIGWRRVFVEGSGSDLLARCDAAS